LLNGVSTTFSILACAKGNISDLGIILCIIAAWIISGLFAIGNAVLILLLPGKTYFKLINCGIWLSYIAVMIAMVSGWYPEFAILSDWGALSLVFGFPIIVIAHFAYLLLNYRKRHPRNPEPLENAA
jgi:hypothetical protein